MRMKTQFIALGMLLGLASTPAQAFFPTFTPGNLSSFATSQVNSLIQTIAISGDHHAYQPATSLGLVGFDIGVDGTVLTLPSDFTSALTVATGAAVPSLLILPKLNLHKGLPFGIDLGFSYTAAGTATTTALQSYGADIKYAILDGGLVAPTLALRVSGSLTTLSFLQTRAYSFDAVFGKNFVFIDPYVGAGISMWSGSLNVPVTSGLAVAASHSGTTPRVFAGAQLKLGVLHITGQMDYSTVGLTTWGFKAGLGF